jgi:2-polyprenyl-6-methoxyphenol hydroxylase-like FAD-dependent oxidoreductase
MRILIAGAGIGGLTFINALGQVDCTIDVAERSDEFHPLGVGIVLHPNAIAVLDQLGLAGPVGAAGARLDTIELVRDTATLALSLPDIWQGLPYPTIAIFRPDLHDILVRKVESDPRVHLRMGTRVTGVVPLGPRMRVRLQDDTSEDYDLVVGADGVRSAIRQSLWPSAAAASTGLAYVRFPARHVMALGEHTWRTYEAENSSFGFIPLSNGRVHCFYQFRADEITLAPGDEDAFLRARVTTNNALLEQAMQARCGPYHVGVAMMVRPGAWGRNAAVLLGDAAHAVPPTLSEGGGLAMEDAFVLARVLKHAKSVADAIRHYESCRHDRIAWMYRMGLSQVNARRRGRSARLVDPATATLHMREMYSPLRAPVWREPPAA